MSKIKLSFDVDGTLVKHKSVQDYARELIERGFDVWITTRRYENIDRYDRDFQRQYGIINLELEHKYLFELAKDIGIPRSKIRFTNMDDKYKYFTESDDFLWHLDDDHLECNDINKNCHTRAIQCNSSNWRHKCEKLIKFKLKDLI